jgi:hypothetical protein
MASALFAVRIQAGSVLIEITLSRDLPIINSLRTGIPFAS